MPSIGPQIPPHLLKQLSPSSLNNGDDDNNDEEDQGPQPSSSTTTAIGPQIPSHLLNSTGNSEKKLQVFDEDDDEDEGPQPAPVTSGPSIGPTLPPSSNRPIGPSMPSSNSRQVAGPSMPPPSASQGKRSIGPSLPPEISSFYADEESDDDDIGPKPLPAGMQQYQQSDAVQEFLEREEKRRKAAEEAAKPKAPKREEWMLVPPTTAGLLGNLDPTKLKARQFSTSTHATASSSKQDTSLWTETPQERQQRLADEVSGKKRRVTDAPAQEEEDEKARKRRRKQEEEAIRRGVDEHTRKARGAALVDQHKSKKASNAEDSEVPGIWDHSRDMALGGRLMDDEKRNKMLKEAKGLGDRFGSGKSGGFL